MTITIPAAAAPSVLPPHTYTDPTGHTWDLDRSLLDWHAAGWTWDGQPYADETGPVLHAVADPRRSELLLALSGCAGLWQVSVDARQDLAHWMDPQDALFRACARTTP